MISNSLAAVMPVTPVKVLIVDDSLALCRFLEKILSRDPDLHVVGYALDAFEARDLIKLHQPDVITLDVEMPRMDGITFLRNLMRLRPMPVVMLSSLTAAGAEVTLDALDAGAVDFMVKRHPGSEQDLEIYVAEIVQRVKQAGRMRLVCRDSGLLTKTPPDLKQARQKLLSGRAVGAGLERIIAVGSSTGGPEALRQFLTGLDAPNCALLFAQHMPERFMEPFAARLDSWSSFDIAIARNGEKLLPGRGYVAPGDYHLQVTGTAGVLSCLTRKTNAVNGHRPSVDVLFGSVAKVAAKSSVGVLLTGMGEDGAEGLTEMRSSGALTIAQDKKSSAVWGMPGSAVKRGGVDAVIGLQQISPALTKLLAAAT